MKQVDLHMHSTYSDGTFTPEELIALAEKTGLSAVALTDHDTLDGTEQFCAAARKKEIEALVGVELSLEYEGTEIHLLGYFVQMPDLQGESGEELLRILRFNREEKGKRHERMAELFQQQGIPVELVRIREDAGCVVNRVHFARELIRLGYVQDVAEAFFRYLGEGKCCFVPRTYLPAAQGIRAVLKAGGVPVLAHPWLCFSSEDKVREMILTLKKDGLAGVECEYADFSLEQKAWLCHEAEKQGLLVSGGTDFHGSNKRNLKLGTGHGDLAVPYSVYEKILKRMRKES